MEKVILDQTDRKILEMLSENSKKKFFEIAKEIGVSPSTVFNRIKKLEDKEVILNYRAIVDQKSLGMGVTAIVHIVTEQLSAFDIAEKLSQKAVVEEVYTVSGMFDIIAKIRFRDNEDLGKFIYDPKSGLKTWKGVQRTESMLVLKPFKEHGIANRKLLKEKK